MTGRRWAWMGLIGLLVSARPAIAADTVEIERLLAEARPAPALERIVAALRGNPRDIELRFLQAVALARLGRVDAATAVFETLTRQGEAVWEGKTAGSIVQAMQAGSAVTYTVPVAPNGAPRSTLVPLEQFSTALEVYQQVLEAHGLV